MEKFHNDNPDDGKPKIGLDIFANHRNADGTVDWEAFIRDGEERRNASIDAFVEAHGGSIPDGSDDLPEMSAEDIYEATHRSTEYLTEQYFAELESQQEANPSRPDVPPTPEA